MSNTLKTTNKGHKSTRATYSMSPSQMIHVCVFAASRIT
jgi:hypothetical protein